MGTCRESWEKSAGVRDAPTSGMQTPSMAHSKKFMANKKFITCDGNQAAAHIAYMFSEVAAIDVYKRQLSCR